MRKFVFTVIIEEGCDEFWESVPRGAKGAKKVQQALKENLYNDGWNVDVKLIVHYKEGNL